MANEAFAFCQEAVAKRIDQWAAQDGDVQRRLGPVLERMFFEIRDEITAMEKAYRDVYLEIGGGGPLKVSADGHGSPMSWFERVLWAGAGFLMHDVGMAVAGGTLGWRGFLGTIGGYLTGGLAAALLGITGLAAVPIVLITGLLAQLAVTRVFLEDR